MAKCVAYEAYPVDINGEKIYLNSELAVEHIESLQARIAELEEGIVRIAFVGGGTDKMALKLERLIGKEKYDKMEDEIIISDASTEQE